jgi:hypothetical protein
MSLAVVAEASMAEKGPDACSGSDGRDSCFLHRELLRTGLGPDGRWIGRAAARLAGNCLGTHAGCARGALTVVGQV